MQMGMLLQFGSAENHNNVNPVVMRAKKDLQLELFRIAPGEQVVSAFALTKAVACLNCKIDSNIGHSAKDLLFGKSLISEEGQYCSNKQCVHHQILTIPSAAINLPPAFAYDIPSDIEISKSMYTESESEDKSLICIPNDVLQSDNDLVPDASSSYSPISNRKQSSQLRSVSFTPEAVINSWFPG